MRKQNIHGKCLVPKHRGSKQHPLPFSSGSSNPLSQGNSVPSEPSLPQGWAVRQAGQSPGHSRVCASTHLAGPTLILALFDSLCIMDFFLY